jgi:hypothetical protein
MGSKKYQFIFNEQLQKEFKFIAKTNVSDSRKVQHTWVEFFDQP